MIWQFKIAVKAAHSLIAVAMRHGGVIDSVGVYNWLTSETV
jgi:hypothetical protein